MSEVINCKRCGKIFRISGSSKLCEECKGNDYLTFKEVREYIYDNPGASILEVAAYTGINESMILSYLREGRLETVGGATAINCESCGIGISSGKYCSNCEKEIKNNFISKSNKARSTMVRHNSSSKGTGMYTNKDKK